MTTETNHPILLDHEPSTDSYVIRDMDTYAALARFRVIDDGGTPRLDLLCGDARDLVGIEPGSYLLPQA